MIVGEESVVFLRESPPVTPTLSRRSIEIRAGQADFDSIAPTAGAAPDFEFQVGEAKGVTRAGADGRANARARRSLDGASRVMIYEGETELQAAGRAFTVARGMGASVTSDGRTSGPEKLLVAPLALAPNGSQDFDYSNPSFDWDPVEGASTYTVEVCRDADCGQLVDRATGVRATRWTPRVLPLGALYWRVLAVSPSGLDGYSSKPLKFTIRTYWRRPIAS
jgi:hypothetical protein